MKLEQTQTSAVYELIRLDIINGNLAAQAKLKTRELADRFDVGLSPIREALSRLSSEGWVLQSDRRGFSVVPLSIDELWDLHHARCSLNEICLRESIERGDTVWEENIQLSYFRISRLRRPAEIQDGEEMEAWNKLHKSFHSSLICACKSRRMLTYCEGLFDEIERYRRVGLSHGEPRGDVGEEHENLAQAAIDRDAEKAAKLLNEHYTKTVIQVDNALRGGEICRL